MTITYKIQNVTPDLVHTVMLRKFFQMVFMGNDRHSLHIYTALVIGASNAQTDDTENGSTNFISNLNEIPNFRMKFQFQISNSDNNEIEAVSHEDITTLEHGFLNEINCIRKVWGEHCEIIFDDQQKLREKLEKLQNDASATMQIDANVSAEITKSKLLWTSQAKNGINKPELTSLSIHGEYSESPEESESNSRDDIAKCSAYSIGVPKGITLPVGIELVNWVRTTIKYKDEIDDNNLNYVIKHTSQQSDKTVIWAPDFTWYFSPVVKSYIDNHNSIVEVKWRQGNEINTCSCPLQKRKDFVSNDKFQNSIDTVPNKMTVDFYYWTQERIRLRQKYRLAAREILPDEGTFNHLSEINIFLDTADEHSRGNRQFITSILVSFALAFGIDSTRLKSIAPFFDPCIPADILWVALLTIFSLTLINTPVSQRDFDQGNNISNCLSRHSRELRKWALGIGVVWVATMFVLLRIDLITDLLTNFTHCVNCIMQVLYLIAFLINLLYLSVWKKQTGGRLWANLLGKDIL